MNSTLLKVDRVVGWLTPILVVFSFYMAFLYAPTERNMGHVQRLFYWHVASAWIGFLAFFVVMVASILYLRTRKPIYDQLAGSSAEIGVMFITLVLLTGPIWARPIWNSWWSWDPRLTTTLILWFMYIAYMIIRASAEGDEKKARLAAVFGIIAFADVPIVHMSVTWWRSIHPLVITLGKMNMEGSMFLAMMTAVLAASSLYVMLLFRRFRLEVIQAEIAQLKGQYR